MTGHQGRVTWHHCNKLECSEKVAAPTHLNIFRTSGQKWVLHLPWLSFQIPALLSCHVEPHFLCSGSVQQIAKRSLVDTRPLANVLLREGWDKKQLCSWMQLSPMAPAGKQCLCLWWCRIFVCLMWLGQESQDPCCQSTQVNEYELGHCHYNRECLKERL